MNILEQLSINEISDLLRKPSGKYALEIANMMADHNAFMNTNTHKAIQLEKNDCVLEMGIGNGAFLQSLQKQIGEGKLIGIDYSETMIEEAKKLNAELIQKNKVEVDHGFIDNMPFSKDYFDKIITVNTVYFWDNPINYLQEIKRVLKIGGKLAIGFRPKHIIEKIPFAQQGFTFYTIEELSTLLTENGFTILIKETKQDERITQLETSVIVAQKK